MNKHILPNDWKLVKLCEIAKKCTEKNHDFVYSFVLTNSAQQGIVPQTEHFDREIVARENIDGYFVVNNGDFVYNPRISANAPCGPIRRNHLGQIGIMSPLYTVFKLKENMVNSSFIENFFLSSAWHRYMKGIANYGARHDRMAITDNSFFAIPIPLPPIVEQNTIAKILDTAERVIAIKERLIAAKRKQKQWLMQNLLTGKIRLPGFSGEWDIVNFSSLFRGHSTVSDGTEQYPLYSLTLENGVTPKTERYERSHLVLKDEQYKIVFPNDYVYNPMNITLGTVFRHTGDTPVTVSHYYDTFALNDATEVGFFDNYLVSPTMIKQYNKMATGSLKEKQRVHFSQFIKFNILLPNSEERQAIASVLTNAEHEIKLLSQELEQQRQLKKYLMQQLLTGKTRVNAADQARS
jgi:type I restriction enzyme S subunit